MNLTHSPGPWHATTAPCGSRLGLLDASLDPIAFLGVKAGLNPADVRLIESAPELLESLEELLAVAVIPLSAHPAWLKATEAVAKVRGTIVNHDDIPF